MKKLNFALAFALLGSVAVAQEIPVQSVLNCGPLRASTPKLTRTYSVIENKLGNLVLASRSVEAIGKMEVPFIEAVHIDPTELSTDLVTDSGFKLSHPVYVFVGSTNINVLSKITLTAPNFDSVTCKANHVKQH